MFYYAGCRLPSYLYWWGPAFGDVRVILAVGGIHSKSLLIISCIVECSKRKYSLKLLYTSLVTFVQGIPLLRDGYSVHQKEIELEQKP